MTYEPLSERRRATQVPGESSASRPPASPPGLTAALIYLRPVPRARLLATLANLGVFVREYQSLPVLELWGEAPECELALVAGGNDPAHLAAVSRIVSSLTPAVVALVQDEQAATSYGNAGVLAAVRDGELDGALVTAVTSAAQHARQRRELRRTASDTVVVGDVRFAVQAGRLECNGRGVGLSGTEMKVLRRLTATPGVPVSVSELEGAVQQSTGEAPHGSELRATILRLRRKLEQVGGNPLQLGTVRGFGYVLQI